MYRLKEDIYYTGKIDWELRKFHGDQLSTDRGSTYNSYLILDEKKVLIDTVWLPYADEFINDLKNILNPADIDCIIVTHAEPDHSGALIKLTDIKPDIPIYCTKSSVKSITGHYHRELNFNIVKTGDKINTGKREITFIEAPFLHWPDTMMCHLSEDNILFSSDVFGQHIAAGKLNASDNDQSILYYESLKYYANIIAPFSEKTKKKIAELKSLNFSIDMICPAHGLIWDSNPQEIINLYEKWADNYSENQVTILYDTMYNSTRQMAEKIAEGITGSENPPKVKVFNLANTDKSDILAEIFRSKGIIIGSPTHNNGVLSSVAGLLEEIEGMELKGKTGAVFGSYGWAEKATKKITESLTNSGFLLPLESLKCQWVPDNEILSQCIDFGKNFASSIKLT
jgi:anaerobic nitric oxide reductase flavorubredoxin